MGKTIAIHPTGKGEGRHRSTALFLVSSVFFAGGVLGYLTEEAMNASLYVQPFLDLIKEEDIHSSIRREIWLVIRWPLGILILRYLPMTGFSIPVLVALRGFLLSYSIAAFSMLDCGSAFLLFGPTCILTLPVLFILSTEGLLRKAGEKTELRAAVVVACLLALCLCILIDLTVIPLLMT